MIILKSKGIYYAEGEIVLNPLKTIHWKDFCDKNPPQLPVGSSIELSISFDENNFLSGIDGIVWATYDSRQAEIIQNTLLAQQIGSEIQRLEFGSEDIHLIKISNSKDVDEAINFIWKDDSGLRLKPDWNFPTGETNKSFDQWLNWQ